MKNFIPKSKSTDCISIRIQSDRLELINSIASEYTMSRNQLLNQCIDFALKHMQPSSATASSMEKDPS
jgi:hypothetical protein